MLVCDGTYGTFQYFNFHTVTVLLKKPQVTTVYVRKCGHPIGLPGSSKDTVYALLRN